MLQSSRFGSRIFQAATRSKQGLCEVGIDGEPRSDEADGARLDACWHRLTDAGNQAFAEGDLAVASGLYREALDEAERLFDLAFHEGGMAVLLAPMVHNIACQNAAEVMKQSGHKADAGRTTVRALEKLVTVAASAASPLSLRVNCVRHMKYALAFLDEHVARSDTGEGDVEDLVAQARAVAAEVFRIAGYMIEPDPGVGVGGATITNDAYRHKLS